MNFMFEVIKTYLEQLIQLMPSIIGIYVLFDFLGGMLPNNRW